MNEAVQCPVCDQLLTRVGDFWVCPKHGPVSPGKPADQLRIFLSYGHDANEELVLRIKADLEVRSHEVWCDKSEIRFGDDWRRSITDGITRSHRVLSFLSKHSTRDPGVCLDEIAIAIGVKHGNIQTVLVESEVEVKPPPSIGHIQWLDMHDWRERKAEDFASWEEWYHEKLAEIVRVVESKEARHFGGEIETLAAYLKPISSDARVAELLKKGFVGRAWLHKAVEEWRQSEDRGSRLFWITGDPGVGKSAFCANLTHFGRDRVVAAEFVQWNTQDHRNAERVIRSLAFQLAARFPDYRKLLLTLPEIRELDRKNPADLFRYLLVDPLKMAIHGGRDRYLILIDALDEAADGSRNPLVELLARDAQRLPDWLGLVITSRPETAVTTLLQGLNPFILDAHTEANRSDVRDYLQIQLLPQLQACPDADQLVERIMEESEGVFLYIERFCDDVQQKRLSLDNPRQFPQGLGGTFVQWFQRQFPDVDKFCRDVRPALRAILAAREPLPLEILQRLFRWQDEELRDFIVLLGSLFQISRVVGHARNALDGNIRHRNLMKATDSYEVIAPFHKSVSDWLLDTHKAGQYFVSELEGHKMLAGIGWNEYKCFEYKPELMHEYFINNLPEHLRLTNLLDNADELLTDFPYLIEKFRRGNVSLLDGEFDMMPQALKGNSPLRLCVGWHARCFRMLMALVPPDALASRPAQEIAGELCAIVWEHKASTPYDEDEYWMARSPFDGRYHIFASWALGGGWPTDPAYVETERPSWFDED